MQIRFGYQFLSFKKCIAFIIFSVLFFSNSINAQKLSTAKEQPVACNGDADALPGKYTGHTQTKYLTSLKGTVPEKAAEQRLADIGKFYDSENEKTAALYNYNPAYFKTNSNQPTKPVFIEVQFRYEIGDDRGFSERLLNNFLKNYDMNSLRKMLE